MHNRYQAYPFDVNGQSATVEGLAIYEMITKSYSKQLNQRAKGLNEDDPEKKHQGLSKSWQKSFFSDEAEFIPDDGQDGSKSEPNANPENIFEFLKYQYQS